MSTSSEQPTKPLIEWYRSPVDKDMLQALNERSDLLGFLQTGGYIAVLLATGTLAWYSSLHWPVWITIACFMLHATCMCFLINGMHELVHGTVFKTKWLNRFFLPIFSFPGLLNHEHFWASHAEHHKYTLHPPDDLEVVLPIAVTMSDFLKGGIVDPGSWWRTVKWHLRTAVGRFEGEWENTILPESAVAKRRKTIRWARVLVIGHAGLLVVSVIQGWWQLPLLVTFGSFYCNALHRFCNSTQHIGLKDNVPDFRLCCRTMYLSPPLQFLYWHMNFHIEHHMYAAAPCYRLGALNRAIRHDLPHCTNGIVETWKEIDAIVKRQKAEPEYQYVPELPVGATT